MSSCSGNCASCSSSDCGDRKKESLLASLNPNSTVKQLVTYIDSLLDNDKLSKFASGKLKSLKKKIATAIKTDTPYFTYSWKIEKGE